MTGQQILTKTTSKGQTVVVEMDEMGWLSGWLDGQRISQGSALGTLGKAAVTVNGQTYTHTLGKLGFTTAEAGTIYAAQAALRQANALREDRRSLVASIRFAMDDEDAFAEESSSRSATDLDEQARIAAMIEAAQAALVAFDAAHPEVREAIRAERTESAERHIWD
mgnify:CR=1 FL=1